MLVDLYRVISGILLFWGTASLGFIVWQQRRQIALQQALQLQNEKCISLQSQCRFLEQQTLERQAILKQTEALVREQFTQTAKLVLEEQQTSLEVQQQKQLSHVLEPFKQKIQEFQQQVERFYHDEAKQRFALGQEIIRLSALNQEMNQQAQRLTNALQGNNKVQGIWGEYILEMLLEASGLQENIQYQKQLAVKDNNGDRWIPDVVVKLPNNRQLVIDAKMNLLHYERYCRSEDKQEQQTLRKQHIDHLRNHIKQLSSKAYQKCFDRHAGDFVVMFVPIESALSLALSDEQTDLIQQALALHVVLASPMTLLSTLKMIQYLWRDEMQNQNALAIAKQGGLLYDKFTGFLGDIHEVSQRLAQAQTACQAAQNKLHLGRGNLVGQAEKLRELGVKPQKEMPKMPTNQWDVP